MISRWGAEELVAEHLLEDRSAVRGWGEFVAVEGSSAPANVHSRVLGLRNTGAAVPIAGIQRKIRPRRFDFVG